jgi:prepilin-type N-terminal cleavage/methylation domain-containing protein
MRLSAPRRGFTLLEVILALSVGVLLLGALYVSVDVQLRSAQAGRNIVGQGLLARSILNRMDADISATVSLVDPERYRMASSSTSSGSSGSGSSGGSGSGTASTSGGNSMSGNSSSNGNASSNGNTSTTSINDAIVLPLSVQGDSTSLNLYLARVPREAMPTDPNAIPLVVSDLRRVSWWLTSGGLAREEVNIETAPDALDNLPPGIPDEDAYVYASEVKNVQFQYFDGSDWQDTWDCTVLGADNVTPIGPPQAIAITLDIAVPQDGKKSDDPPTKRYRHVVACITANGTTLQQQPANANGSGTTGNANGTTGGTSQ